MPAPPALSVTYQENLSFAPDIAEYLSMMVVLMSFFASMSTNWTFNESPFELNSY